VVIETVLKFVIPAMMSEYQPVELMGYPKGIKGFENPHFHGILSMYLRFLGFGQTTIYRISHNF